MLKRQRDIKGRPAVRGFRPASHADGSFVFLDDLVSHPQSETIACPWIAPAVTRLIHAGSQNVPDQPMTEG